MNKQKLFKYRTYAKKPGQDSKSLFLTHKYLRETWFAEFACVSPKINIYEKPRLRSLPS